VPHFVDDRPAFSRSDWASDFGGHELQDLTRGRLEMEDAMESQAIGWIAAIIVGGVAGWLAEQFMKSQMGLVMNIVLGIVGAVVASWLLSLVGVSLGGWLGYLIAGFIGACILIFAARAIRRTA
jgi:uncharacterized membrane protein YeaQ/YmgE (transglycosylase-associated protein family)